MLTLPDILDLFVNKLSGLGGRGFAFALSLASLFDCGFPWHMQIL
jgi:hypothetical protein